MKNKKKNKKSLSIMCSVSSCHSAFLTEDDMLKHAREKHWVFSGEEYTLIGATWEELLRVTQNYLVEFSFEHYSGREPAIKTFLNIYRKLAEMKISEGVEGKKRIEDIQTLLTRCTFTNHQNEGTRLTQRFFQFYMIFEACRWAAH